MPTPSDSRLAAWRAFLDAHAAVIDVLTEELAIAQDLPLTWYDVLVQLAEADDDRLRMQELADQIVLSKSGLTRLVQRMEEAGLVRREPCEDDRRGIWAVLTLEGRVRLRDAAPSHLAGVARHFTDHLSDEEARILQSIMTRVKGATTPVVELS